jgi:predicted nucleic acid-binding protein
VKRFIRVASLVDTNLLVYRYDFRFRAKQAIAIEVLRQGLTHSSIIMPHQALLEFVSVASRPMRDGTVLLRPEEARREAGEMLRQFPILFPNENVFQTALRGVAAHQLAWFDAHLWAYAESFGLGELLSEDFQDGRRYGRVLIRNPFAGLS